MPRSAEPTAPLPLIEPLVRLRGLGYRCQACGSGRSVSVYAILGRTFILDWMCAAFIAAAVVHHER